MIDTLKPICFDLAKGLHGHVRIETRDRWTGRVVDSQEKDNLLTDAVQRMIMTTAWLGGTGTNSVGGLEAIWAPLYSRLFGGIFLFDSTLTEAASNISLPSDAKLVAYAGQGSNSTSPNYGSWNLPESVFTANGFTTVWDFSTAQANGTIAALARTSNWFEGNPVHLETANSVRFTYSSSFGAYSSGYYIIGYDETNKYLYFAYGSNIYRAKQDFSKIHLNNAMPLASQLTLIKTLTSEDGATFAQVYAYDKYANKFVYITGTTIHFLAVDGTHTTGTATGTSGNEFAITENYYWRSTGSTIYRISKSNTANVETYSVSDSAYLAPEENDIIFAYSMNTPVKIVYPDGTYFQTIANTSASSKRQAGPFLVGQSSTGMGVNTHYLATIANLDSPVTKTSSQTMKITYTLTEA